MSSDLPNPFRKGGAPRRPPSGLRPEDLRRLYLVLVAGSLIIIVLLAAYISVRRNEAPPTTPPESAEPVPASATLVPAVSPEPPPVIQEIELQKALEEFSVPDPAMELRQETPGFVGVLTHFVKHLTPEEASSAVQPALTPAALFENPGTHRGSFLRIRGRLIQLYTQRLQCTTPTGTEFVYLGILQTAERNAPPRIVHFYLAEKPVNPATGTPWEFQTRYVAGREIFSDLVEIEGMFLRLLQYETQGSASGNDAGTATAAVLFVRNLKIVEEAPTATERGEFVAAVVVAAALLIGIVLFGGYMSRKHGGGNIHLRLHRARQEQARRKGQDGGGPPSPSDPTKEG